MATLTNSHIPQHSHANAPQQIAIAAATALLLTGCFECRPGDVATTNGRAVCKASGVNTSVKSYRGDQ